MKLLIAPYIDRFPGQEQESALIALGQLIDTLKTVSVRKSSQAIELQDDRSVRTQIDSALYNLDIDTMLDPTMPNCGGMEIIATIKRDLSLEIETKLSMMETGL